MYTQKSRLVEDINGEPAIDGLPLTYQTKSIRRVIQNIFKKDKCFELPREYNYKIVSTEFHGDVAKVFEHKLLVKIRKKVKSKEDFDRLLSILSNRIKNNTPISDNPMLDGAIISFMVTTSDFTLDLFLDKEMGRVLEGTIQKLEQIAIWVSNNEDKLCELL